MEFLKRYRWVFMAALSAVLIVAAIVTWPSKGGIRVAGRLGPTPGPNSAGYAAHKRAYLAHLASASPDSEVGALVSFNKYVPGTFVQELTTGMKPQALFVRFPTGDQEAISVRTTVNGTLADRATDLRNQLQAEIASIKDQLAKGDAATKPALQKDIDDRTAQIAQLRADCSCVFAVAVQGAVVSKLTDVARHPEVRLVDVPDPLTNDLEGWQLQPIVPATPTPAPKPT
jgi:hypothetical protein